MESFESQVTIVGAGPAGAVLSVLLARSGVQATLLESHSTFDREFRGNAFQPSVLRIWDEMGLTPMLASLEAERVGAFVLRDGTRRQVSLPLHSLPSPHNFALITPQAPLLKRLVEEAARYPNFRFLGDCPVRSLVMEEGRVAGVLVRHGDKERFIRSQLVVAADGRNSTVRSAVGIELERTSQDFDFIWFDLPRTAARQDEFGLTLTETGILVNLPKGNQCSQVGWVIPKGTFPEIRKKGMAHFIDRVRQVEPELAEGLTTHLKRFDQCSLLDVKVGMARTWAKDGLVLMGDAAHIASPIGAQGNKLAIEDAVLLHPLIVEALKNHDMPLPARCFASYTGPRRKEVGRILKLQNGMGRLLFRCRSGLGQRIRSIMLGWLNRSPFKKTLVTQIAIGADPVHVDTSCFGDPRNEDPLQIYHPIQVKRIIEETPRAKTLVLDIPENLRPTFSYLPGQFTTLRLLNRGVLARRAYSFSTTPGVDPEPAITVKWLVNGRVSTGLVKEVKEGDTLWLLPPVGGFVHRPDTSRPRHHVMFAAGSGITPIYSILKSILANEPESRVTLIYGNHDERSIIFKKELEALAEKEAERFQLSLLLKRLDADAIDAFLEAAAEGGPPDQEYYLCGPAGMMDLVHQALKRRKVAPAHIHFEMFASLHDPGEPMPRGAVFEGVEVGEVAGNGVEIPQTVTIKINGKKQSVPIRKDETILDAALRAGLPAPYSCQSAMCATCTGKLKSGRVRMPRYDALTDTDLKRQNILACQAVQLTREAFVDFDVL